MKIRSLLELSLLLLLFPACSLNQNLDPISNYCKRFDHQSTVKERDGKLYIVGGIEVYTDFNYSNGSGWGIPVIGPTTAIVSVDLTTSWNWGNQPPISEILLTTGATTASGGQIPLLALAGLYSGSELDDNIYLFGGTTPLVNTSFPVSPYQLSPRAAVYAMWSYNIMSPAWVEYTGDSLSMVASSKPNAGARAEAPDQALAFYFGGQIDAGSSDASTGMGNSSYMLTGMMVIDTNNHTARNISTDDVSVPARTRGKAAYVSNVGHYGLIVLLGGIGQSLPNSSFNGSSPLVPLDTIDLFDISSLYSANATGTWFRQQATGDIPEPRMDFCIVYQPAPDDSSHQIYLYGGRDHAKFYDDMYVLSLPAFKWIRLYTGHTPRAFHTCHVVASSQMITVGGTVNNDFLEGCDWESKGVAIYNFNNGTWGSIYDADAPTYQITSQVSSVIGGSTNGNATIEEPENGWDNPLLGQVFREKRIYPMPSRVPSNICSTIGRWVAVAIGTVVAVGVLIVAPAICFVRYKSHPNHERHDYEMEDALKPQPPLILGSKGPFITQMVRKDGGRGSFERLPSE